MKFKLPIQCLFKPTITQPYGDKRFLDFYHKMGVMIPFHNGTDLGIGSSKDTFGTPLICPFPIATTSVVTFNGALSSKGNGVRIIYQIDDSTRLEMILWHMSDIKVKQGQILKEGDLIGYIGNSGLNGSRTSGAWEATNGDKNDPWKGAHVHIGMFVSKLVSGNWVIQDIQNGVEGAIDPMIYLDANSWFKGDHTADSNDTVAVIQFLKGMGLLDALIYLKRFFKF
jgi:hypothetical protein